MHVYDHVLGHYVTFKIAIYELYTGLAKRAMTQLNNFFEAPTIKNKNKNKNKFISERKNKI